MAVVVGADDQVAGGDRSVGREGGGDVGLSLEQRAILECDVVRANRGELKAAVETLQPGQAVGPGEELLNRRQAQAAGLGARTRDSVVRLRLAEIARVVASACESFIGDGSSQTRP